MFLYPFKNECGGGAFLGHTVYKIMANFRINLNVCLNEIYFSKVVVWKCCINRSCGIVLHVIRISNLEWRNDETIGVAQLSGARLLTPQFGLANHQRLRRFEPGWWRCNILCITSSVFFSSVGIYKHTHKKNQPNKQTWSRPASQCILLL